MRLVGFRRRKNSWLLRCLAALMVCVLASSAVQGELHRALMGTAAVEVPRPAPAQTPEVPFFSPVESDAPYSKPESVPPAEATPTPAPTEIGGDPVVELVLGGGEAVEAFSVRDSTGAGLDLNAELQEDPNIRIKTDGTPMVLIYHTHTTECFLPMFTGYIAENAPTRTLDETQSVVAVGEKIAAALTARGIGVVHDKTVHDSPAYTGAYDRSWETIQKNLAAYPSIVMTIDVHRDAMIAEDGTCYKPTVEINGKKAAQVMIITGRDPDGSYGFPHWRQNLHMALKVQEQAAAKYGELMRPLNFCDRRYNMNATVNSLLVEFGTHVNTLEEALYAGTLFGDALADVLLRYAV